MLHYMEQNGFFSLGTSFMRTAFAFYFTILLYNRFQSVTEALRAAQACGTFGNEGVLFALILKSYSTDSQHTKNDPWPSGRDCKQAGSLKMGESQLYVSVYT